MAKIDFSTIEGFEEMTAEEKLAAIENYEIPDPDYTGFVKKDLFDKVSSEVASYKKKEFERMTEEEAAKAKAEEERSAMQARLEELERDKKINEYTAQFLGIGYDKELARETAEAPSAGRVSTLAVCPVRASMRWWTSPSILPYIEFISSTQCKAQSVLILST